MGMMFGLRDFARRWGALAKSSSVVPAIYVFTALTCGSKDSQ